MAVVQGRVSGADVAGWVWRWEWGTSWGLEVHMPCGGLLLLLLPNLRRCRVSMRHRLRYQAAVIACLRCLRGRPTGALAAVQPAVAGDGCREAGAGPPAV